MVEHDNTFGLRKAVEATLAAFDSGAIHTCSECYRDEWDDELSDLKALCETALSDSQCNCDENASDGYHTFKELYRYRLLYNAAFFNELAKRGDIEVVKSWRHNDGDAVFGGGWFIVMAQLPTGQISNHYEAKDWDLFHIPEVYVAPVWDGHTPNDAANRIEKFIQTDLIKDN